MKVSRSGKKFLAPSEKYEIWLQLVRQETTIAGAASAAGVDRSVIVRLSRVARDGALAALAASRPGPADRRRDAELEAATAATHERDRHESHILVMTDYWLTSRTLISPPGIPGQILLRNYFSGEVVFYVRARASRIRWRAGSHHLSQYATELDRISHVTESSHPTVVQHKRNSARRFTSHHWESRT